ncbi:hypothetical protein OPT61_g7843 [Boeremia exigua]|uniref:Uncharacterized protein n=1 Tax=Boeremia exigua TaxID=749465 RepID=A0ACC2I107_9PLEO|nr:hypothetical protein OPT61_g7843 [Boeremia exigua]
MALPDHSQGPGCDTSTVGMYRASPTKLMLYGQGTTSQLKSVITQLGGTKAFVITGRSLYEKTSVIKNVEKQLDSMHGGTYYKIGQHAPIQLIREATAMMSKSGCDVLVSVGGGSPIDSAKAIAHNIHKETGKWVPSIAIPTTLSVAETTQNAGFTTEEGHKIAVSDPEQVPKAVIYDGENAIHTPMNLWLSTGMRALDHAVELMYHPLASEIPTKRLCLEAIKDLFTYLPQSKVDPNNAEIRTKLFLACYASLFPFLFSGGIGLSHSIGHAIGASYAIPHGITSCLSLAPVVRLKAGNPDEAKQIARIIPYINKQSSGDDSSDARSVADAIAELVEQLGLRTTLTAYGVPSGEEEEDAIASRALHGNKEHKDFTNQHISEQGKPRPYPHQMSSSDLCSIAIRNFMMQRTFHFAGRRNGQVMRFFSTTTARPAINKIFPSAQEALKDMKSDTTVLVGGFGFSGVPNTLINELRDRSDIQNLRVVSNNAGMPGVGLGQLLETKQIGTMVASYIGDNKVFEQMYLKGELSLELTPQGTIAEKCAAGAAGVPAFYTPAAYGTIVQTGELPVRYNTDGTIAKMAPPKETREFNGKSYILEEAIFGDYAFVKVAKADRLGNCQFRKAQNNFNEAMGKNAKITIVEADEIVEDGQIAPEDIHLQGIYVKRVIKSTEGKQIERTVFYKSPEEQKAAISEGTSEASQKRERKLQEKVERLGFEAEEWKTKYKQSKTEANNAQNTLQKEITSLRDAQRTLQLKLRDVEVQNDDFERQTRNQTSSLEDIETKYNVAIEREVLLEEEIKIGERERESLRIETQRLRDELSDLKIESEITQEKLRLAEVTIEKHHQRTVSNHLAKDSSTLRPRSPMSEASTTNTNLSSPTAASTPPYMQTDTLLPDSTPPSPPLSDAPLVIRPIPFAAPVPTRKASIASRDPSATPRAGVFARPRHTRGPSVSGIPATGASPAVRRTPSVMRPPSAVPGQRPSRPSIGGNTSANGLPRSGSLYQIRGLIGKMQKLEERVHSARSKLPAPLSTPPRASPRPPSAAANYLPTSVSVRKRASQASTSVSSVGETTTGGGKGRPSFGVPSTASNSRPSSRASMSSTPQLPRVASKPSPVTRSSTVRTPGTRTPGVRTPSTRTPGSRNPLGHYSSASMSGRIGKAPPPILHLHEGRQFGRQSLNRHPSDYAHAQMQNFSRSDTGSDDGEESEIKTPIGRRSTMERSGIPTPGSGLPRRTSMGRRISASMDGGMGPPVRPRKMSTYEEETY